MPCALRFLSSLMLGAFHALGVWLWGSDLLLVWLYAIGVLTSIANHGWHQDKGPLHYLRYIDRAWMVLGTSVDSYYVVGLPQQQVAGAAALVVTYVGCFFLAKWRVHGAGHNYAGNLPHLCTHMGATCLHLWLLKATWERGSGSTSGSMHVSG